MDQPLEASVKQYRIGLLKSKVVIFLCQILTFLLCDSDKIICYWNMAKVTVLFIQIRSYKNSSSYTKVSPSR
jgi:hypothetical protein